MNATLPDHPTQSSARPQNSIGVLSAWIKALSTGDLETLLGLYSEHAILVPTLQNELCMTQATRRSYFEMLLANPEMACTLDHLHDRSASVPDTVIAAGHYTFSFRKDGVKQVIPARFLFTFENIEGQWLITGHHSSQFL